MLRSQSIVTTIVSAFVITFVGMGCSSTENTLGSNSSLDVNSAAEAIATLPGNSIDAELLALTDDIEEVSVASDSSATLPNDRPRPNLDRLQSELSLTEDRIAAARRFFNANVRELRQLREMFPSSIIASIPLPQLTPTTSAPASLSPSAAC